VKRRTYSAFRNRQPLEINAAWEKWPWTDVLPLMLDEFMGPRPAHFPRAEVKLAHDEAAVYVIFRVEDRYVCARKQSYQERVCEDSCVEFFFTPGEDISQGYFNLEVSCGGIAFFHHQKERGVEDLEVARADFRAVELAHTLSAPIHPEIAEPLAWVVEYRLPFDLLASYAPLTAPAPGVTWRANFYKCADACSHPHWLTWAPVDWPEPDFHRPEFFGELVFE